MSTYSPSQNHLPTNAGGQTWTPTWRPRCTAFAGRTIRQAEKVFTVETVSLFTLQRRVFLYLHYSLVFLYLHYSGDFLFTLQQRLFLYLHCSRDCFFIYTTAETVSLFTLQQRPFLYLHQIYTAEETVSLSKLPVLRRLFLFLYLHYSGDCFFICTILTYFLVPIFLSTKSLLSTVPICGRL